MNAQNKRGTPNRRTVSEVRVPTAGITCIGFKKTFVAKRSAGVKHGSIEANSFYFAIRASPLRDALDLGTQNVLCRQSSPRGDAIKRGKREALTSPRMPSRSLCIGMQTTIRGEAREGDASTVRVGCRA